MCKKVLFRLKQMLKATLRVQRELKVLLRESKEEYGRKVEQKLQHNNMREVWRGVEAITGCKKSSTSEEGDTVRANQLNQFFNRFDCPATAASVCPPSTLHKPPQ